MATKLGFKLRSKILAFQENMNAKKRKKNEERLRRDIELNKLQIKAKNAKRLNLSADEKEFIEKKIQAKKEAKEKVDEEIKKIGRAVDKAGTGLAKFVVGAGKFLDRLEDKPKRKPTKKKSTKRKKRR